MNAALIEKISGKLLWTPLDIQQALGIGYASALVFLSRGAARGEWVRLRNGVYLPAWRLPQLTQREFFQISNFLQVPSYISLTTALQYRNVTTQMIQSRIESISPVRSNEYSAREIDFVYYKIQKTYYFGITQEAGIFIATPEKALMDCLYLEYFDRYKVDRSALSGDRLDVRILKSYLKIYRKNARLYDFLFQNLCKICKGMNNSK